MEQQSTEDQKLQAILLANKKARFRTLEILFWWIIVILLLMPMIFKTINYVDSLGMHDYDAWSEVISHDYYKFLLAIIIGLFPILFRLIFYSLPLEYIRDRKNSPREIRIENSNNIQVTIANEKDDDVNEKDFAIYCIRESEKISERIFSRSGVYLLVGCLIAFVGVAIFYSPFYGQLQQGIDWKTTLLNYLPRFGALFLVEFIAFFFLKQYRIMLEEYRYYEAIKRNRQDNYNIVELVRLYEEKPDLLKSILASISNEYPTEKMNKEEVSKILEVEKTVNQDLDIFVKLNELVKTIKSK